MIALDRKCFTKKPSSDTKQVLTVGGSIQRESLLNVQVHQIQFASWLPSHGINKVHDVRSLPAEYQLSYRHAKLQSREM